MVEHKIFNKQYQKAICGICGCSIQTGENNVDIGKYTICSKCNSKWAEIIKYYTNSD